MESIKTLTMREYRRDRRERDILTLSLWQYFRKYPFHLTAIVLALPIVALGTCRRWKTPLIAFALPVFAPITFV